MADDATTDGNGLIRQVQQILGATTPAAGFAALLYARTDGGELEGLTPARLARNAREAFEFIAEKPKGRHKVGFRRTAASAADDLPATTVLEVLNDDMPFLVELGAGRGRSARAADQLAAAPDLQDQARPLGPAARPSRDRATAHGATGIRKATSPSTCRPCPRRPQPTSAPPSRRSCGRSGWWCRTGNRCWQAVKAANAALGSAPASIPPPLLTESDRLPGMAGARQFHLPRRAGVRAVGRSGDRRPGACRRQRARRAARPVGAGAAARPRAGGDDAGGPPLLLCGLAVDHHQGERRLQGAPPRAHGLHRHQDVSRRRHAQGRDPRRRAVHVAILFRLADASAVPAPQGRRRARRPRLSAHQPRRQGDPQHPGKLPARRAVPDRRQAAARMGGRHPRSGDAAARARVCPHRPLRPVRLAAHLRAARPLHLHGARADRRACCPRSTTGAWSPSIRISPTGRWCACSSSSRAMPAPRRRSPATTSSSGITEIIRTWEDRLAHAIAASGGDPDAAREARKQVSLGLLPGLCRDVRAGAGAGGHQAHRAAGAGPAGRRRLLQRARRPGARGDVPVRPAHAAVRARADPGKPRLLRHRRAHLPRHAALQRRHARGDPARHGAADGERRCHRPSHSRCAAGGCIPGGPAWQRGQRRLQPADRVERRGLARGGHPAGVCRLSAPARLAVRPALSGRHAQPPCRRGARPARAVPSPPQSGSQGRHQGPRGGRGADPQAHRWCAERRAKPGRGPHPAAVPEPDRGNGAHQLLPGGR